MHTVLVLLLGASMLLSDAPSPVAGRSFNLAYDPAVAGVLSKAGSISVVYAFDYWGTTAHQILRGEPGGPADLFQNVLNPDPGRAKTLAMHREGKIWKATIDIPATVRLLSWYFTDGKHSDDNGRKTYVACVCDDHGNPVRGARLANVDFLFMAGKSTPDVLKETEEEIKAYPDNMLAHVVYWRFRYFDTISPDTLKQLMTASNASFAGLRRQFGDSVLNYQVASLGDVDRIIWSSLIGRAKDPDVKDLIQTMKQQIIRTAEQVPAGKLSDRAKGIYYAAKDTSAIQYDLKAQQEQWEKDFRAMVREFVGQQAPDFEFTTTAGEKHRLSDLKGTIVLLDFWGSWCGPCVQEIPHLRSAYEEFKDRGVVFISVTNDRRSSKWKEQDLEAFAAKNKMTWMQVLDDDQNSIHTLYKIRFWPNPFLIDKDGKVIDREHLRGETLKKTLAGAL